jgi:protein gp37
MAASSKIEWTDRTWNPLRGCSRVSPGCQHCYAERVAYRFSGPGQPYENLVRTTTQGPKWTGDVRLVADVLGAPLSWAKPSKVFVNSMSDLFHESVPFEFIASVFAVMSVTTRHTYQVLTKRPERMLEFFQWVAAKNSVFAGDRIHDHWPAQIKWKPQNSPGRGGYDNCGPSWPCENVWLGVSAEDQKTANARIPLLLQVPAAVRFLSMEPLLGSVNLHPWLCKHGQASRPEQNHGPWCDPAGQIDWVIVGGESGPQARPTHPNWVRSLRDQCAAANVPWLFKQWGEFAPGEIAGPKHGSVMAATWLGGQWIFDRVGNPQPDDHCDDEPDLFRIGKKAAGRLLDGVQHDGFPT